MVVAGVLSSSTTSPVSSSDLGFYVFEQALRPIRKLLIATKLRTTLLDLYGFCAMLVTVLFPRHSVMAGEDGCHFLSWLGLLLLW